MPRKSKTTKALADSDIKLTDYANACLPRADDGTANRVSKKTNALLVRETKDWFDCDLADFEEDHVEDVDSDEELGSPLPNKKSWRKRKKLFLNENEVGRDPSCKYPQDLWFLIARAIAPEDIARFALLCRGTYLVVESISYWKDLYNRHFVPSSELPVQLLPGALNRVYGLKTLVVQSLFHMYDPYKSRVKDNTRVHLSDEALDKLSTAVCVSSWHEMKAENHEREAWIFYFKFRHLDHPEFVNDKKNQMKVFDDIKTNFEQGCFILKVSCSLYCPIPSVLSLRLKEITFPLSRDMRTYKVRLKFRSQNGVITQSDGRKPISMGQVVEAVLEGVSKVDLLNWWHPKYPHKLI